MSTKSGGTAVLLEKSHLEDPTRYVKVERVPIFDAHRHEKKGNVDEHLLELIAENTNERVEEGSFPLLQLGHTYDDDVPEEEQPEDVGVAMNYRVEEFQGRPCIYADFYYKAGDYDRAMTYPNRSVERIQSESSPKHNYFRSIALLRRASERPLGILTKNSEELPSHASRECYSITLPDGADVEAEEYSSGDRVTVLPGGKAKRERDGAGGEAKGAAKPVPKVKLEPSAFGCPPCPKCGGAGSVDPNDTGKCVCSACEETYPRFSPVDLKRVRKGLSKIAAARSVGLHESKQYRAPSVNTRAVREQSTVCEGQNLAKYQQDIETVRYLLGTLAAGAAAAGALAARKPIAAAIGAKAGAAANQLLHQPKQAANGFGQGEQAARQPGVQGASRSQRTQPQQQAKPVDPGSLKNIPKWVGEGFDLAGQAAKEGWSRAVQPGPSPARPTVAGGKVQVPEKSGPTLGDRAGGLTQAALAGGMYLGGKAVGGVAKGIGRVASDVGTSFADGWRSQRGGPGSVDPEHQAPPPDEPPAPQSQAQAQPQQATPPQSQPDPSQPPNEPPVPQAPPQPGPQAQAQPEPQAPTEKPVPAPMAAKPKPTPKPAAGMSGKPEDLESDLDYLAENPGELGLPPYASDFIKHNRKALLADTSPDSPLWSMLTAWKGQGAATATSDEPPAPAGATTGRHGPPHPEVQSQPDPQPQPAEAAPVDEPPDPRLAAQQAQMARNQGVRPRYMDRRPPSDESRRPLPVAPAVYPTRDGDRLDARQFRQNLDDFAANQPPKAAPAGDSGMAGFESRLEETFGEKPTADPAAEADASMVRAAERAGLGDEIRRMVSDGSTTGEIASRLAAMGKFDPREASRISRAFARSMGVDDPKEARAALPSPVRPLPAPSAARPTGHGDQLRPPSQATVDEPPAPEPPAAQAAQAATAQPQANPEPQPQAPAPERVNQVVRTPSGHEVRVSMDARTAERFRAGDPAVVEHVHREADRHASSRPHRRGEPDMPSTRTYETPTRPGAVLLENVTSKKTGRSYSVEFPSEAHGYLWEAGRKARLAASPDADPDVRAQAERDLKYLAAEFAPFGLSTPEAVADAGRAYYGMVNRAASAHSGDGPIIAPESAGLSRHENRDWEHELAKFAGTGEPGADEPPDPRWSSTENVLPEKAYGDPAVAAAHVHQDLAQIPEAARGGMWRTDPETGARVLQGPPQDAVDTDPYWKQMSERSVYPKGVAMQIPLDRIKIAPALSQHRIRQSGKFGAGPNLDDVNVWDHEKAGNLELWQADRDIPEHGIKKGDPVLFGGHTRFAKANQLGVKNVNAIFMNAKDPAEARLNAAINNVAQGNVDPMDAAKIFRDLDVSSGQAIDYLRSVGASMKKDVVAKGVAMSQLPDRIWSHVMREYQNGLEPSVPYDKLAAIGDMGLDERDAISVYKKAPKMGVGQLRAYGSLVRRAIAEQESSPADTGETDLFGDPVDDPSYEAAAAIADAVRRDLSSEATLMGRVGRKQAADKLGDRGVAQVDPAAARANRDRRRSVLAHFEQQFQLGRFHDRLLEMARNRVPMGQAVNAIIRDLESSHDSAATGS